MSLFRFRFGLGPSFRRWITPTIFHIRPQCFGVVLCDGENEAENHTWPKNEGVLKKCLTRSGGRRKCDRKTRWMIDWACVTRLTKWLSNKQPTEGIIGEEKGRKVEKVMMKFNIGGKYVKEHPCSGYPCHE